MTPGEGAGLPGSVSSSHPLRVKGPLSSAHFLHPPHHTTIIVVSFNAQRPMLPVDDPFNWLCLA